MKYFLSSLKYYTNNKRTFDILIHKHRLFLKSCLAVSIISIISAILALLFRITLQTPAFLAVYFIILLNVFLSLYLGYWHTNLTSRQRYRLFTKRDSLPRDERVKTLKKYLLISFCSAITSGVSIIVWTLNNYIIAFINTLYFNAETYIKYSQFKLNYHTLHVLIGSPLTSDLMLIIPIFIYGYLFFNSYDKEIKKYNNNLIPQWLESRYFQDKCIDNLIHDRDTKGLSTIRIGIDSNNRNDVIMNAATRALNVVFFGLIGTGKSSSIAKPIIISDTENFIYYIRKFADYIREVRSDISQMNLNEEQKLLKEEESIEQWFNKGLAKDLTNGFYVNEPSGDLIADALKIIKKQGLPSQVVWLIDPPSPDTDAINILDADVTQAAALTADLFRNFSEGEGSSGTTFFLNSEETHTRNLVNLLKFSAMIPDIPINEKINSGVPTLTEFDELLRSKDYLLARMAVFNVILKREERIYNKKKKIYDKYYDEEFKNWIDEGNASWRFDANMSPKLRKMYVTHRDETALLNVLRSTYDYFKHSMALDKSGNLFFVFDANISGLKSVMGKLSTNIEVRRVFFSPSTKSIDALLKMGGIILVNSAKSRLGDSNSKMVGQVAEIIMQSGAFRRIPNVSPFFPFMNDEKNTILMSRDQSFLDQNRKFKTPVIHLYQDIEQAIATVGKERADALFQSYRNAFVFQQGSPGSLEFIANRAGVKKVLEESDRYSQTDLLAGNDSNDVTTTETIVDKEQLTKADMSKLEEFEYAGIMVVENEISDVQFITSVPNFRMPLFADKNFKSNFNISNPNDREDFQLWEEQVEKYYLKNHHDNTLQKEDFTEQEWEELLSISQPDITDDIDEPMTEMELREKMAKEDLDFLLNNKEFIDDSKSENMKSNIFKNKNIIKNDPEGTAIQNIHFEEDFDIQNNSSNKPDKTHKVSKDIAVEDTDIY
ncbi:TPA: TraM recognition domain-containing protein [Streptococcus agalactiae]|nr:TraM recognition domain-containing protein [Streptococcus agalactiae]HEO4177394.1 TraM recognition domain-containing protein [Streptococcus agalactiae]